jgi:hypothetical protein
VFVVGYFLGVGFVFGILAPEAWWAAALASCFPSILTLMMLGLIVGGRPDVAPESWRLFARFLIGATLVPGGLAVAGASAGRALVRRLVPRLSAP